MTTAPLPALIADTTVANFTGLKGLESLRPSEDTNRMFSSLVASALVPMPAAKAQIILGEIDSRIGLTPLHTLCAEGEYAMEHYWAKRIKDAVHPKRELKVFPYWNNYLKLAALEVKALRSLMPQARKVLFAGGGPLPLSTFIMAKHYGFEMTNLDIDGEAIDCAMDWMGPVLGNMEIPCVHSDINDFTDFAGFDVVIMAALVGLDSASKRKVVAHLHAQMRPDQLLMVRSVRGLRSLLYPKVKAEDLQGFEIVKEVHPRGEVVNSVILARKIG